MPDETYKFINQDCIHWFCKECNRGVAKLFKTVAALSIRQDKVENDVIALNGTMQNIQADVAQLKGSVQAVSKEVSKVQKLAMESEAKVGTIVEEKVAVSVAELKTQMPSQVNSSGQVGLSREDVMEAIEIEKRKLNVVIIGLKEDTQVEDDELAKDVIKVLTGAKGIKAIAKLERIGIARQGKIRPLRVVMVNIESKIDLLRAAPDLKKYPEWAKVSLLQI